MNGLNVKPNKSIMDSINIIFVIDLFLYLVGDADKACFQFKCYIRHGGETVICNSIKFETNHGLVMVHNPAHDLFSIGHYL